MFNMKICHFLIVVFTLACAMPALSQERSAEAQRKAPSANQNRLEHRLKVYASDMKKLTKQLKPGDLRTQRRNPKRIARQVERLETSLKKDLLRFMSRKEFEQFAPHLFGNEPPPPDEPVPDSPSWPGEWKFICDLAAVQISTAQDLLHVAVMQVTAAACPPESPVPCAGCDEWSGAAYKWGSEKTYQAFDWIGKAAASIDNAMPFLAAIYCDIAASQAALGGWYLLLYYIGDPTPCNYVKTAAATLLTASQVAELAHDKCLECATQT